MPGIDFEARRPWIDARLDALAAAGAGIVVAEVDGAPAGFVTVEPLPGRADGPHHLDQLAVHPAHQGGGVADLLIEAARALSPGGLDLEVNADNPRARRFYARHGFVETATGVNPASGLPTLRLRWRDGRPEDPAI